MAMGLQPKPGPARPRPSGANDYPEQLVPELPKAVADRFPELEAWQKSMEDNYDKLIQVLLRRDREIAGQLDEFRDALP